MRYRVEPCGNRDFPAMYRVVDAERSGLDNSLCETALADATAIAAALNLAHDLSLVEESAREVALTSALSASASIG